MFLHRNPPWSLTGADATMGRRPDVALCVCCGKAEMQFGILGPLEVRNGEAPVRVPGAKERALLADLLVNAGRVVSADRLVEDLWGDDPPGRPANTLQGRVSALRRALGPGGAGRLVTSPPGYRLDAGLEQLDATRFERLVAEAEVAAAAAPARAAGLLEEALGLWRGPALAEFADQPWARPRRPGWRSCAWPPARPWSSCGWPPAATPGWSGSWRRWLPPTRPGSGSGAS
jgi:DNA-binding winged helix-turn-helix (wHTH) protein